MTMWEMIAERTRQLHVEKQREVACSVSVHAPCSGPDRVRPTSRHEAQVKTERRTWCPHPQSHGKKCLHDSLLHDVPPIDHLFGPSTACFQIAVRTDFPCQSTSRGRPTFTDKSFTGAPLHCDARGLERFQAPLRRGAIRTTRSAAS